MSRRLSIALVLAFVAFVGGPAGAQFGNPLKRAVPPAPQPAEPKPRPFCHGITDETVDQFIKAKKLRKQDRTVADAEARLRDLEARQKAAADAEAQGQAAVMVDAMQKLGECEDAAREKHPRQAEQERLNNQSNAAYDRGDQTAGDRLNAQSTALAEMIDRDVKKACEHMQPNMHGTGALAEEAARDQKATMDYIQCMAEAQKAGKDPARVCKAPATGQGPAAQAENAKRERENAERQAARAAIEQARADADKKAANDAGIEEKEMARVNECIAGRLRNPSGTPSTPESNAAIDKRASELQAVLQ
jgi:hypothetical protein